jgi:hypothetical protein
MFKCPNFAHIVQIRDFSCKNVQSTDSYFYFFQCLKFFFPVWRIKVKPIFFSSSQQFFFQCLPGFPSIFPRFSPGSTAVRTCVWGHLSAKVTTCLQKVTWADLVRRMSLAGVIFSEIDGIHSWVQEMMFFLGFLNPFDLMTWSKIGHLMGIYI